MGTPNSANDTMEKSQESLAESAIATMKGFAENVSSKQNVIILLGGLIALILFMKK